MNISSKERSSGILLHITSLPNEYGIGDFGKGAYDFIDFLERAGQKNWQILPLGMTGYGASPYQCFSAFAGNPYLIALDELIEEGLLEKEDLKRYPLGSDRQRVQYDLIYQNKMKLLRLSYQRAKEQEKEKLEKYYKKYHAQLRDFAVYMALRKFYDEKPHQQWQEKHRISNSKEVRNFEQTNQDEIYFWIYTQYLFSRQWKKVKEYANRKKIKIIGDMPIYVSADSSDVWANPKLFKLDEDLRPKLVAGCPPDAFSKEGQLWGNPIYDWKNMEKDDYSWWIRRVKHSFTEVDTLRIDHFRGFESFWQVPYGAPNAVKGKWSKGPGYRLFKKIKDELGDLDIIAEDLGFLTEKVVRLIGRTGYPGMKILQFAFSSEEESDYLPHHFDQNAVVYTGTHDNNTLSGWFKTLSAQDLDFAVRYMKLDEEEGYNFGAIRTAWSSTAYLAVVPMQDFLELGEECRMNTPSTVGGNWEWRVLEEQLTEELAEKIWELTKRYGR